MKEVLILLILIISLFQLSFAQESVESKFRLLKNKGHSQHQGHPRPSHGHTGSPSPKPAAVDPGCDITTPWKCKRQTAI